MKRLDLNLELSQEIKEKLDKDKDGEHDIVKIAGNWIKSAIQNACNKPAIGQMGMQPTRMPSMEEQEKFVKVSNCLSSAKEGIVVIEDDTFKWLKDQFNAAKLPMQDGLSQILVQIRDRINKADITDNKPEEKKE